MIAGTRWRLPCGHLTWMRACRLTCSQVRVQSDCSGLTHGQNACCANGWHCTLRIFVFAPDRWPLPQGATPGRSGKVLHSCAVILTSSPVFQTSPTPPFAAPAGRPLPKVQTPGRKMLRSGSAALQRLTQMVGRSRQIYKASVAATCVLSGLACSAHAHEIVCGAGRHLRPRFRHALLCSHPSAPPLPLHMQCREWWS